MANILFVHQNFPSQFVYIAQALEQRGHKVVAIGGPDSQELPGIDLHRWKLERSPTEGVYPPAAQPETDLLRAEVAAGIARQLWESGFQPDVIVAHPQWGETIHFRIIFPAVPQILFGEFYYHASGLDYGFDSEFTREDFDNQMRINAKNSTQALAFLAADVIVSPTEFQASTFPDQLRPRMRVIHEGVNAAGAARSDGASVTLKNGDVLDGSRPVVTYVSRILEPLRGFHTFMRALPAFLDACPDAHVLVIGREEGRGYGPFLPDGRSWKTFMLAELGGKLDLSRVQFLGKVPYRTFIDAMSISWAHVYYTYPYVLSWSLLEAMACECLVIASDTAPVRDVITNGKNGILLDFFDVPALTGALIGAASAPMIFRPLRAEARNRVLEKFEVVQTGAPEWIALVETMAAKGRQ